MFRYRLGDENVTAERAQSSDRTECRPNILDRVALPANEGTRRATACLDPVHAPRGRIRLRIECAQRRGGAKRRPHARRVGLG